MLNKNHRISLIISLAFAILYCTYLSYWFIYTNSYTSEANIHALYDPLISSLKIFEANGLSYTKYCLNVFYDLTFYPSTSIIFPIYIYILNLGPYFIEYPWLINVALSLFLVASSLFIFYDSPRQLIVFLLLVFSFPLTQIALKGFSIHAWVIVLLTWAIFTYDRYKSKKLPIYLVLFILLATLSCSLKHLGIIYFSVFLFVQIVDNYLHDKNQRDLLFSSFLILSISALFYPISETVNYIEFIFRLSPEYTIRSILFVLIALIVFSILFFKRLKSNPPIGKDFISTPLFVSFFIFLVAIIITVALNFIIYPIAFYACLIVLSIFNCFILYHSFNDNFQWNFLIVCSLQMALFLYLFAPFTELFLLPFFTLFYLLSKDFKFKWFLTFFILSNFFISNFFINKNNFTIKFFFYSYTWQPLTWHQTQMQQIQKLIKEEAQHYLPNNELSFGLISNLYFSTKMEFNWLPFFSFTELPEAYHDLNITNEKQRYDFFKEFIDSGDISIFINVLDKWDEYVDINSILAQAQDSNKTAYTPNRITLHQQLSQSFEKFLDNNQNYKEKFQEILLPKEQPIIKMYIHKMNKIYNVGVEERRIQRLASIDMFKRVFRELSLDIESDQNDLIESYHLFRANEYLQAYIMLSKAIHNKVVNPTSIKLLKLLKLQLNQSDLKQLKTVAQKISE